MNSFHPKRTFAALLLAAVLSLAACKHGPISTGEYVYVASPQLVLRDRVAAVYNKVGTAKNGERLEVLEHAKRFVRVRTPRGEEGWVEQRSLADPDVYEGFQKLAADNKNAPVQGKGKTRAELNMHLTAARDGETLYQLSDAEQVDILARATAERLSTQEIFAKQQAEAREALYQRQVEEAKKKADRDAEKAKKNKVKTKTNIDLQQPTVAPPKGWDQKTPPELLLTEEQKAAKAKANKGKSPEAAPKAFDDWWLVRNKQGKVGWVLARMVDLDIPLEIAQYAEGQRVMGAYVLNTVKDEKGDVPQYLVVLNEPKDGTPWDFSQLRVFSWNRGKHRYETAYRERNLVGYFPVKTGTEDFGKEGVLPTFVIRKKNEDGTITERKYRMIGPIVREVKSEGEPKAASSALSKAERAARKSKKARKH